MLTDGMVMIKNNIYEGLSTSILRTRIIAVTENKGFGFLRLFVVDTH